VEGKSWETAQPAGQIAGGDTVLEGQWFTWEVFKRSCEEKWDGAVGRMKKSLYGGKVEMSKRGGAVRREHDFERLERPNTEESDGVAEEWEG